MWGGGNNIYIYWGMGIMGNGMGIICGACGIASGSVMEDFYGD